MNWSKEEKHMILNNEKDYPELARIEKLKNERRFRGLSVADEVLR